MAIDVDDLRRLVREHAAECLFVASTATADAGMSLIAQVARQEGTEVRVCANLTQTLTSRLTLQPQFWNALGGEMGIVGTRPLPADQVAANLELLRNRQEVPAGLTGWWQVNGRSTLSAELAVRLDPFDIESWSLALDLYIVLETFGAVLSRHGAY